MPRHIEPPRLGDAITVCRRQYPLEGTTLAVIGSRNAGRHGPKVKVLLPYGSHCWRPAAGTSPDALGPGAPRLAKELPHVYKLRKLHGGRGRLLLRCELNM